MHAFLEIPKCIKVKLCLINSNLQEFLLIKVAWNVFSRSQFFVLCEYSKHVFIDLIRFSSIEEFELPFILFFILFILSKKKIWFRIWNIWTTLENLIRSIKTCLEYSYKIKKLTPTKNIWSSYFYLLEEILASWIYVYIYIYLNSLRMHALFAENLL